MPALKPIDDDVMPEVSDVVVPPKPNITLFNAKGIKSIVNQKYLNCWEGSVRSGKTLVSIFAWLAYLNGTTERTLIMSGKSQGSLYRNVISGPFGMLAICQDMAKLHTDRFNNKILTITTATGDHDCYLFGANDASSYELMHGLTAGGWLADEINCHNRIFVNEGFMRTIASTDRKHFWTMNPGDPNHFVYSEYMDVYLHDPPLGGYNQWFFTLDDNPAIDDERKAQVKSQYSGVFYRRNILGERCAAEGAIYDMMDESNYYDDSTRPRGLEYQTTRYIGIDHGTHNPTVFLDMYDDGVTVWIDREYYHSSRLKDKSGHNIQKDPAQYTDDFLRFSEGEDFDGREFVGGSLHLSDFTPLVVADPSAAPLITAMRNRAIAVKAAKNDVLEGIGAVSTMLRQRNLKVNTDRCPYTKKEMAGYSWNEKLDKVGKDQPLKINDHCPDVVRYIVYTMIPKWRWSVPV
jgi:PBSX family phage terminase large subunit